LNENYQNELEIEKDKELNELYNKVIESEDSFAQYNLGLHYYEIEKDEIKAFEWFEKSANQEQSDAQNYLGYLYENDIEMQKDLKKAFYWYQKSAENGNKFAQYNLISYYLNGWKIDEELIEQENDRIQFGLGYFYELQKDLEKSFYWYQKSAENGNKFAQYNLGLYYQNGCGIEKDEIEAFKWYEKSAEQNNSDAQNYLGFFYKNGISIRKDLKKSFYWYQKSAENGNKIAQYNLGNFYRYGWEIEKDETKAQEWYKELAGPYNKFFIKNSELINSYDADNNIIDDNSFNEIQFNEPIVNANCETNSEFITVKATIFPGISNTSYTEVKRLQKLLISRKDDIDYILNLQPVYAIGIDFQKNSTRPCIACWVAKSLDITVLECLETIFEDQFEAIFKIVTPLNINEDNYQNLNDSYYYKEDLKDDDNNNNNGNGISSSSGSNNSHNGNNNSNNSNGNNNVNNNGNNGKNNDNYGGYGGGGYGGGYGGGGGGDGGDNNNNDKRKENRIYISSKVNAKVINSEFLQDFNISANLWANIIPFEENIRILEYDVDVNVCGIGDMLSNQCPLLNKIGLGYLLHSVEVHVSPLPDNGNNLFGLKGTSQPRQLNRNIEYSMGSEKSVSGQIGIPKISDSNIVGVMKKNHSTKYSSNEWQLFYKGPNTKGERWLYQYIDQNLDKNGSHRESFVPGVHSSQWFIYEGMRGFCITVTQILRCEITHGWRRFLPNTKILLQQFPMMAHNVKVTFNDLEGFNSKLKNLNKTYYYNYDDIDITVGSNEIKNEPVNKTQNIQNLDGKIKHSLGLK
jgi:TPR repeat protein